MKPYVPIPEWQFWVIVASIVFLVLLGGMVPCTNAGCRYQSHKSGLTIGLMGLDSTNLNILKVSGTTKEKIYASKIEPIRKNGHLLLVSLLLVNTVVNESLPILFDMIHFTGYKAVLSSTVLIVLFGEIIPQAVCSRYGLQIGAYLATPVRGLIYMMWIIAYPIAKFLDWVLGHKQGLVYRHSGLKELIALHSVEHSGPLSNDEVSILRAVLDLRGKTVKDIMTNIEDVFMLSVSDRLDRNTISKIVQAGHSRVPVYMNHDKNAILGTLLVKRLILNEPDNLTPISALKLGRLPRVCLDTPLFEMMHIFEAGSSHMALIVDEVSSNAPFGGPDSFIPNSPSWNRSRIPYKVLGIITLEDIIEELIGEEIIDETDVYIDINTKQLVPRVSSISDLESTPLLTVSGPSGPINPHSALPYRSIKLPIPHYRERKGSKRAKKRDFDVDDLKSDLLSSSFNSQSRNREPSNLKDDEGEPSELVLDVADLGLDFPQSI